MRQNQLVGLGLIAFGVYLLFVKLNFIAPFDALLLLSGAFFAGYIYRRNIDSHSTTGLLLVGSILGGLYLSNHIGAWFSIVPGMGWVSLLGTPFFIGLAFLFTWLVETDFGVHRSRRFRGYLFFGALLSLVGGYDAIMTVFNLSPAIVRSLMMPTVFVLIGLFIILSNSRKKIV